MVWCRAASLQGEVEGRLKDTWSPRDNVYVCHNKRAKRKKIRKRNSTGAVSQTGVWLSRWQSLTSHFHTMWSRIEIQSFTECTLSPKNLFETSAREKREIKILYQNPVIFFSFTFFWHRADSVSTYSFSAAPFQSPMKHHATCLTRKGVLSNIITTLMASRDKWLLSCSHCLYSALVSLSIYYAAD